MVHIFPDGLSPSWHICANLAVLNNRIHEYRRASVWSEKYGGVRMWCKVGEEMAGRRMCDILTTSGRERSSTKDTPGGASEGRPEGSPAKVMR